MRPMTRPARLLAAALGVTALLSVPASAATPGRNGQLVYVDGGALMVSDLDPGTDDARELVPAAEHPDDARWSPDGTKVAYTAPDEGGDEDVFVINADGTGKRQVTHRPFSVDEVDWSPDGAWLVFSEYDADADTSERIAKIRVNGTGFKAVTAFQAGRYQFEPRWSPDGRTIAYTVGLAGSSDIRFVNPDGSSDRRFRAGALYGNWSPDGTRMVFGAYGTQAISVVKLSGGPTTPIGTGHFVEWSPDGAWIVFGVFNSGPTLDLFRRRADGTGVAEPIGPAAGAGAGYIAVQPLCSIKGNGKANTLTGTGRSELICGFGGNDTIDGRGGLDIVLAGPGNDTIKGGNGNDVLLGQGGNDRIDGQAGKDRCVQGPGHGPLVSC